MKNRGISFISTRFVITVFMLSMIALIFYAGIKYVNPVIEENRIKNQILSFDAVLHEMINGNARDVLIENSQSGEKRIFTFNLPSDIAYFSIGTDADADGDGKLENKLMYDGGIIAYKIRGRNKHLYWFDEKIKFRLGEYKDGKWIVKKPEEGLVIEKGGKYKITFEVIKYHGEKMILILWM